MADEEQLRILKLGHVAWNVWRETHGGIHLLPDFRRADLRGADLRGANLSWAVFIEADLREAISESNFSRATLHKANLSGANLSRAFLKEANLSEANLSGANLQEAYLGEADLSRADLRGANLSGAHLGWAHLTWATLSEADFNTAHFFETILANVDLTRCKNLESVIHDGPSPIDTRTLQRSGPLPLAFLRGVGLPDTLIEYLPSLLNQAIQHYSCFISYSTKDEAFAGRLHADLQDKGVRCWFSPEDLKIGDKILDTLDEAIRLRDKVLLVLSEASIASGWVEDEVTKTFAEERWRGVTVMFPVRIDDAVFTTNKAWAVKLRDSRHIGDFRAWKDHDAYQRTLERLLRDLRVET